MFNLVKLSTVGEVLLWHYRVSDFFMDAGKILGGCVGCVLARCVLLIFYLLGGRYCAEYVWLWE